MTDIQSHLAHPSQTFTQAEISQNMDINSAERAHNLAIRGIGPETKVAEVSPPSYEECVKLPQRQGYGHLDEFAEVWDRETHAKLHAQYLLVTWKDEIKKNDLMTFLKKYCKSGGKQLLDELETLIAHETICFDNGFRPHTHAWLPLLGRIQKESGKKEYFMIKGVEAPDIRLISKETRDMLIRYLKKEDLHITPRIVIGADGSSEAVFDEFIPNFPATVLDEKWQESLWNFFLKKEWDFRKINYVVERDNGRSRTLFMNMFANAYKSRTLLVKAESIKNDDCFSKIIAKALEKKVLARREGEVRYVIISLEVLPNEGVIERIFNLSLGNVNSGKNKANDAFVPPRILVFCEKKVLTSQNVERKVMTNGAVWNIIKNRSVLDIKYFRDNEWNLGVVRKESGDGNGMVLDWHLGRCHDDWENLEYERVEMEHIAKMAVVSRDRFIDGIRMDFEYKDEDKETSIGYGCVNPNYFVPDLSFMGQIDIKMFINEKRLEKERLAKLEYESDSEDEGDDNEGDIEID